MTTDQPKPADHAWVHDHLAAALTAGLAPDEQSQFDAHIHSCPDCFDAFTEARDADRTLQRTLDALTPADNFEDRLITTFREKEMKTYLNPLAKRAGFAIAAAVALAATGVCAQYVTHTPLLNNPITQKLAAQSSDIGIINPAASFLDNLSTRHYAYAFTASVPEQVSSPINLSLASNRVIASPELTAANGQKVSFADGHASFSRADESKRSVIVNGENTFRGHLEVADRPTLKVNKDDLGIATEEYSSFGVHGAAEKRSTGLVSGKEREMLNKKTTYSFSRDQTEAGERKSLGSVNFGYFAPAQQLAAAQPSNQQGQAASNSPNLVGGTSAPFDIAAVPVANVAPGARGPAPQPSVAQATTQAPAPAEIAERKIIRNGTVEFEVRSFDDAFATISSVVGEEGGFVSSTSSDKLANGKVRGSISVRVPPEHLDRLLLKIRALGDLKSQQIGANDITKEYTDLESELRALRAMESRLIDIIKTGNGQVKDLVVAEKQLGEYRVRIEKIEGEIRYYNNLVGMATLTITAYEKDIQTPTAAQEQENISLNVETEDVEAKYADARKIIDDAKGRIIESDLKKHDAGQYAAEIVAEIPPDKADFVAAQLKQIGTVANFTRDRKQTTTGGNGAPTVQVEQKPTRFSISLYNLANIAPRETAVLTVAVPDVEAAFKSVLTAVRKRPDTQSSKPIGRIITSTLNGQQQDQMTADIRADVTSGEADNVLGVIRALGETLSSSISENPDTANVTAAKHGIQLRIVNTASVAAHESRTLTTVAAQVPDAYAKLIADLQTLEAAGTARILTSQLNQSDPRTVNATLAFDIRRDALPTIEKAFSNAGIDILSRNVARSNDTANTLDSKVHFQIDQLQSADALPPRRTTILGIEADNVEKSLENLRAQFEKEGIQHIQYTINKESSGRVTGHLIADVPITASMTALSQIHDIGGGEKVNQVTEDPQVPDTRFAKERIDLTLTSRESIVASDHGLLATTRAALASAAAALLWSLYLIITGILFVGPWLAIAWLLWKITRRKQVRA